MHFGTQMVETTLAHIRQWTHYLEDNAPIDVGMTMSQLVLSIVGQSLLGVDLGDSTSQIGRATNTMLLLSSERIRSPLALLWLWLNLPIPRTDQFQTGTTHLNCGYRCDHC